jgi:hypothetical protein
MATENQIDLVKKWHGNVEEMKDLDVMEASKYIEKMIGEKKATKTTYTPKKAEEGHLETYPDGSQRWSSIKPLNTFTEQRRQILASVALKEAINFWATFGHATPKDIDDTAGHFYRLLKELSGE